MHYTDQLIKDNKDIYIYIFTGREDCALWHGQYYIFTLLNNFYNMMH